MEPAKVKVCILNMSGQPLMPCTPVKARKLLNDKKAFVKFIKPFTIQLTIASGEIRRPIAPSDDPCYHYKGLRVAPTAEGDTEPQLEPVPCVPRKNKQSAAQTGQHQGKSGQNQGNATQPSPGSTRASQVTRVSRDRAKASRGSAVRVDLGVRRGLNVRVSLKASVRWGRVGLSPISCLSVAQ